jgi:hypothetical protein
MIALTKKQLRGFNPWYPTQRQRAWITYLQQDKQSMLDALVVTHLDWEPAKSVKPCGEFNRRMWNTKDTFGEHGPGTVGNLTAILFLEVMGVNWKAALLDEPQTRRRAA